ncbi:MAG: hypothetical protein LBH18_06825 [Spirochaetaceae bacterium]|jgi:hypothetical protein|nr:hypothetical protein [Spirochaetaceae bacterium]
MRKQKKLKLHDAPPAAKFCPDCKSGEGEPKRIYETEAEALQWATCIEAERGVPLKAYHCPGGRGWHLTKKKDEDEDGYIPRAPVFTGKVSWEYDANEPEEAAARKIPATAQRKTEYKKPIVSVKSKNGKIESFRGKVTELSKKGIYIEEFFDIKLDNPFSAAFAKDFTDGEYQQITIFSEDDAGKIRSWTALTEKSAVKTGDNVDVTLKGVEIKGKKAWHCVKLKKI